MGESFVNVFHTIPTSLGMQMNAQTSTPTRLFRRSLLAAACAAAAAPAFSQSAAAPASGVDTIQRVEVTGSRLKQIDAEGVSPVQTIRRDEITKTGATNVRELVDSLSAASTSGTLSDIGGDNSFSPGASGASLRNLGKMSTLVLLNGRRISPFPLADYNEVFSNVDSLPLEAIDRVEILKNGGSAIYGSDAVAGVINIITRPDFKGAQIDMSAQKSLRNGRFGERSVAVTAGVGDYAADGWNILGNAEFFSRDSVFWSSILKDASPGYKANSPSSYGGLSTYSFPGNVGGEPVDGCTLVVSGLCRFDRTTRIQAIPGSKRANLLLSGRKRVDGDTEWFSELLYSNIRANYQDPYATYGGGTSVTWGDPTTGLPKTFNEGGLPPTHPLNNTGDVAELRYRFADSQSYQTSNSTQYRLLTGLKGTYKTYDWESAVGTMGGTTQNNQKGAISLSGFIKEIGDPNADVPADDYFNKPGGYKIGQQNSAAVLDTLFPTFGYTGRVEQDFWDGTLRTDLGQLPGGAIQLATGFDLRHEKMTITPSSQLASGDIVGYGTSASNASRNYGAIFAEASLPVSKQLEGNLAGRLDKFPNFGAHFSPKAGLKYKPVDQALFRATYETGFRASNLTESAKSTKFAFDNGVVDPKRCDAAQALSDALTAAADALPDTDPQKGLLQARALQVFDNECSASLPIKTVNNPELKPETSKSFTIGTVLQVTQRWSVSADYWNIRRRNEIGTRSPDDVLANEDSAPGIVQRGSVANDPTFLPSDAANYGITLPTVGAIQQLALPFENLFQTRTSGVDLSVKGSVPTPVGEFGLDIDSTFTASYKAYSTATNSFGDNLAGRWGYPKWVANTTVSHKYGPISQSVRWVYNSRTSLQTDFYDTNWTVAGCADNGIAAADCHVRTYNRLDYSISYDGIKNLTIGLYVRNIFQRHPPLDLRSANAPATIVPPSAEDAQGRLGKLILSYRWL